jgi:hypothetical protein
MGVGGPENDRPDNLALAMGQTSDTTRAKRRGDGDGDADVGPKRAKTSAVCPPVPFKGSKPSFALPQSHPIA